MRENLFFVIPETERYGADREGEFSDLLRGQDQEFRFAPVDRYSDLELDDEARTVSGGLRYSAVAFRQLCSTLGPNFSRLLIDLATNVGKQGNKDRASMEDAVFVFNTLLRRRFYSDVVGKQALVDSRLGLIEGVVTPSYQKLSNWDMFEAVRRKLREWRRPEEFHHAELRGRQMVCVFCDPEPAYSAGGSAVHSALFCSNSENGDASVRATPALFRPADGMRYLRPYSHGCRITHVGANFVVRFEKLLEASVSRLADDFDYGARSAAAEAETLGFTGDLEYNETRFCDLVRALMSEGLPKALAKSVVRRAVTEDAHTRRPDDPRYFREADWRDRSHFHLISALAAEAAESPTHVRSRLEQLAYSVLLGWITF